jgi:Icc-related predicted phosphoesterase
MRLVYTADLHGDIEAYRSLLDLAAASGARAAIVGGDLLPHAIKLASAIQVQRDFVEQQLRPLLASFRAEHPAVGVYLLAGNDDWAAAIAAIDDLEREGLAFPLHERVYRLSTADGRRPTTASAQVVGGLRPVVEEVRDGDVNAHSPTRPLAHSDDLWLAGYACVPITPFSIKDYERRDDEAFPTGEHGMAYVSWEGEIRQVDLAEVAARPSIAEALAELSRRSDPRRTIYVCHTPPADTPLDVMPRGRHVGSRALRAFVERQAPPLTLHGHIHEAPQLSGQFATRLGATWCVNPGNDQRRFHAVTLDTDDIAGTIEHTVYGRPVPSSQF